MLEALNRHFVSVGPNLAKQIGSKSDGDCLKHIMSSMLFETVNEEYVFNAINRLKNGNASVGEILENRIFSNCILNKFNKLKSLQGEGM